MLSLAVAATGAPLDFDRDIRPILSENCFFCHGPDEKKRKAGLRLDIDTAATAEVIVAGKPDESELIHRIMSSDADEVMPPPESKISLTPRQKQLLHEWVKQGAEFSSHWAFVTPRKPPLPDVDQEWARNGIDHFIAARLKREGLRPSQPASKETLIRRASLDLTGLPPTIADVDAFLADSSPDAYERMLNRLLASEHYGERMALVWLDAARYADTGGYQGDVHKTQWPWRDWVVQAYNRNLSFKDFTIQQLAGDLLPERTQDMLLATAFNRNHRINDEGGIIPEEWRVEYVADRVETTSTTWMGLTVGCARCHSHKYDPISQKDFYQLFAFFNNVPENGKDGALAPKPNMPVYTGGSEGEHEHLKREVGDLRKQEPGLKKAKQKLVDGWVGEQLQRIKEDDVFAGIPAPLLHLPLDFKQKNTYLDARNRKRRFTAVGRRFRAVSDPKLGNGVQFSQGAYLRGKNPHPKGEFRSDQPASWSIHLNAAGRDVGNIEGPVVAVSDNDRTKHGYQIVVEDVDNKKPYRIAFRLYHDRRKKNGIEVVSDLAVPRKKNTHVTVTYDGTGKGTGVKIHVNGEAIETEIQLDALTKTVSAKSQLLVGTDSEQGSRSNFRDSSFTTGRVYDLQVFGAALNAAQATSLATTDPVDVMFLGGGQGDVRRFLESHFLKSVDTEYQDLLKQLAKAEAALAKFEKNNITMVAIMEEMKTPRSTYVLNRGVYDQPVTNELLQPVTFANLPPMQQDLPRNRLGLAEWLFQNDHPLTARVAVNRYWQMHFGVGLVKTAEDFGSQGERPSHPELLDWLAVAFRESDWDIKAMHKLILMSATYRQSSRVTPALMRRDPENRLLARGPRFRLYGQALRDQALAVSGLLAPKLGGAPVMPYQPEGLWEEVSAKGVKYKVAAGDDLYRRSMYTFWRRTVPPPSMMNFDNSSREICSVKAPRTNTPLQAMNLLNDPQYVEAARGLATRMMKEGGESVAGRITHGHRVVLARRPSKAILKILTRGFADYRQRFTNDEAAKSLLAVGKSEPDASLDQTDLAAYTAVANILLNLDETVTKE